MFLKNDACKKRFIEWATAAVNLNLEYFKMMPDVKVLCSPGFTVNCAHLFLSLAYGFTKDSSKYLSRYETLDTRFIEDHLNFKNLEKLGPAGNEETKEEPATSYSFLNECYFLTCSFVSLAFGTDCEIKNLRKDYEEHIKKL